MLELIIISFRFIFRRPHHKTPRFDPAQGISDSFERKRHPQAVIVFAPVKGKVVDVWSAAMGYKILRHFVFLSICGNRKPDLPRSGLVIEPGVLTPGQAYSDVYVMKWQISTKSLESSVKLHGNQIRKGKYAFLFLSIFFVVMMCLLL